MRHKYIRSSQYSHDPHGHVQSSEWTIEPVTWNPKKQGGYFHAILNWRGASIELTLDPAYSPYEGDVITIVVTKNDFHAGNVHLGSPFYRVITEDSGPVSFMYKRSQYGGALEWCLIGMGADTRERASACAYAHLVRETVNCCFTSAPSNARYCRQTYAKRLTTGHCLVNLSAWGGSGIQAGYLFMGAPNSGQLTEIGHGNESSAGTCPWNVRGTWMNSDSSLMYVVGDPVDEVSTNGIYVYNTSSSIYAFQRIIVPSGGLGYIPCPPSVSGGKVLVGTRNGAVGILYSSDYGETWTKVCTTDVSPEYLLVTSYYMYYGNSTGVYRSVLGAVDSWTQVISGVCKGLCVGMGSSSGAQGIVANIDGRLWWSPTNGNVGSWTGGWIGLYGIHNTGPELFGYYEPGSNGSTQVKYTLDYAGREFSGFHSFKVNVGRASLFDSWFATKFTFEFGYNGYYLVQGGDHTEGFYNASTYPYNVPACIEYFPLSYQYFMY